LYVDDCLRGTVAIMGSDVVHPLNLGSHELVSINHLVDVVESIAGVRLERRYDLGAPQGVRGRNSDNTRIGHELGWRPTVALREGLAVTYRWVLDQVTAAR
jgi:nucleoside-diphosphate-sugar epimerase